MSRLRLTKITAPAAPAATKAELFYSLADAKIEAIDESGHIAVLGGFAASDYRFIKITNIFQGTTTYTPTTGAKALYVEAIGGGGAGGGAAAASSNLSTGSGGGAGAYSAVWLTGAGVKASYTVQVGAGGTGVSGATGNPGTDTTFDSPSVCTAKGGPGGTTLAAGTAAAFQPAVAGGIASSGVGDITFDGGPSFPGTRLSGTAGVGGAGGAAALGAGARNGAGAGGASQAGFSGCQFGGGGSGAMSVSAAQLGGNGANGLIRVWEFA